MSISVRGATVTESTKRSARIFDGASRGLTIEHLKAFIEEADAAEIPPETRVRLRDELQRSTVWHTVEISAESEVAEVRPARNEGDE